MVEFVIGLRDQRDVGLHCRQRRADLVQEIRRRDVGIVETHAVQVEARHPAAHRIDQVAAQCGVAEIEAGKILAPRHRVRHVAIPVALEPVGMRERQRMVDAAAVQCPVEHDAHAAGVDRVHQPAQAVFVAQGRIDGLEVAHRIRVAQGPAPAGHADRVDRHHPDRVHTQVGEIAQACAHAVEIAAERAHGQLADHGITQPCRARQRLVIPVRRARRVRAQPAPAQEHGAVPADGEAGIALAILRHPRVGRVGDPVRVVEHEFVQVAAGRQRQGAGPAGRRHPLEQAGIADPAVERTGQRDAAQGLRAIEDEAYAAGGNVRQQGGIGVAGDVHRASSSGIDVI